MGTDIALTTLNLKEAGVNYVVAKTSSEIHGKLLQRVGADRVIDSVPI